MKIKLVLLGLLLGFLSSTGCMNAQTYEYKYLYSVRANGEKFNAQGHLFLWTGKGYFTFTDNFNKLYESDEQGKIDGVEMGVIRATYQKTESGVLTYRRYCYPYTFDAYGNGYYDYNNPSWLSEYFYFSPDYSRFNYFADDGNNITQVFEKHVKQTPKQLY